MPTVEEQRPMATATITPVKPIAVPLAGAWTWPLSVPRGVNAQLTLTGQFTKADIARLKKQIEFLEESFDEEAD